MRVLFLHEIKHIAAATGDELPPPACEPLVISTCQIDKPSDWHISGVAGGLFVLTMLFNTAATASVKPNIPFWGVPVALSFGLGIGGTALLIGQGIDWLHM